MEEGGDKEGLVSGEKKSERVSGGTAVAVRSWIRRVWKATKQTGDSEKSEEQKYKKLE